MKQIINIAILLFCLLSLKMNVYGQQLTDSLLQVQLDSLSVELQKAIAEQNQLTERKLHRKVNDQKKLIDSLYQKIEAQGDRIESIEKENISLLEDIELTKAKVKSNMGIVLEKAQRFKKAMLICASILLVLLVLSTLMFFLLLNKHQEDTEKKISALRKYTHNEIVDSRDALLKRIKKGVKRIRREKNSDDAGSKKVEKRLSKLEKSVQKKNS